MGDQLNRIAGVGGSLRRWASTSHQHAADLRKAHAHHACTPITDAPLRRPVRIRGTIKTITLRPRGGVPALEAELDDGSGVLTLIWLGRRRIVGIGPGRSLEVCGRVGRQGAVPVMYNPRYELRP
ncbi:MAG: OB-fold nucleic acid binding domain-containing protein [Nocardioides sp.]